MVISLMDLVRDGQPISVIEAKLDDVKKKICNEHCKHFNEDCKTSFCPLEEL